jgi:hypothetical protein
MRIHAALHSCLLVVLLVNLTAAAEALKSGAQVGEELQKTFEPVNLTGPDVGEKTCVLCEYGANPVVMVFAREVNEPLIQLIKRLDAVTAQHQARGVASCVILLSDDPEPARKLKLFAAQEKIQHTILRTYKAAGPKGYHVAQEAEITAILFLDRIVKANHAFKAGEAQDKAIDAVVADIAKILPTKK